MLPLFLDAPSHLYKRVCPSVGPSVRPSVTPSLRSLPGASYAEYSALFKLAFIAVSDFSPEFLVFLDVFFYFVFLPRTAFIVKTLKITFSDPAPSKGSAASKVSEVVKTNPPFGLSFRCDWERFQTQNAWHGLVFHD